MADERTLGLARAQDLPDDELSKERLQQRLDVARESISHTVTEIKETVASQVQAVKDTLDWREQFKKRPVAWSAGAVGVGFLIGYGVAAAIKGDGEADELAGSYGDQKKAYAAQPILRESAGSLRANGAESEDKEEDTGPSFFERVKSTQAFDKVRNEAESVGDAVISELGGAVKTLVLPALMKSLKEFLVGYLPGAEERGKPAGSRNTPAQAPRYEPVLEHKSH